MPAKGGVARDGIVPSENALFRTFLFGNNVE
jgi:hypothetical protein